MRNDKFRQRNEEPLYWFNKASDLRGTAGLVWFGMMSKESDEINKELGMGKGFNYGIACHKPYYMLCGLSLELAFKAIIVTYGKEMPSSHDLNKLAHLAELEYNEDEQGLMSVLSDFIVWSGKYPTPKQPSAMQSHHNLIDKHFFKVTQRFGDLEFKQQYRTFDWDLFSSLWTKASDTFFTLNGR